MTVSVAQPGCGSRPRHPPAQRRLSTDSAPRPTFPETSSGEGRERATGSNHDLVYATSSGGQIVAQGGDSGGPVFDLRNPDWNDVVARGIISKGNAAGGSYLYYAKYSTAVTDLGITLPTS